ncbi:hypothetical protein [Sedimentibacter sp. zth1]|nr:hypothetical protein [Sedimentibacter sp. zth1]
MQERKTAICNSLKSISDKICIYPNAMGNEGEFPIETLSDG